MVLFLTFYLQTSSFLSFFLGGGGGGGGAGDGKQATLSVFGIAANTPPRGSASEWLHTERSLQCPLQTIPGHSRKGQLRLRSNLPSSRTNSLQAKRSVLLCSNRTAQLRSNVCVNTKSWCATDSCSVKVTYRLCSLPVSRGRSGCRKYLCCARQ